MTVLVVLAGVAALGWMLMSRRGGTKLGEHDAVQWPFDAGELRSLMSKVVAEQTERVSSIQDAAGRNRAQAFLDYYERRRQAAVS